MATYEVGDLTFMSEKNINRYDYITAPITDVDGKPLYYGDICEFTWSDGKVQIGKIDDSGNDYHTTYAFLVEKYAYFPVENCTNIRLVDTNGRCLCVPITKVVQVIDRLKKELLDCGFTVEEHAHGLLVNGKYVVANNQKKWKVVGKNKWYWYGKVEGLKQYFAPTLDFL